MTSQHSPGTRWTHAHVNQREFHSWEFFREKKELLVRAQGFFYCLEFASFVQPSKVLHKVAAILRGMESIAQPGSLQGLECKSLSMLSFEKLTDLSSSA